MEKMDPVRQNDTDVPKIIGQPCRCNKPLAMSFSSDIMQSNDDRAGSSFAGAFSMVSHVTAGGCSMRDLAVGQ